MINYFVLTNGPILGKLKASDKLTELPVHIYHVGNV